MLPESPEAKSKVIKFLSAKAKNIYKSAFKIKSKFSFLFRLKYTKFDKLYG